MDPSHTEIDPTAGNKSTMFAIRGCSSQLESKTTRSNETEGSWSLLPDEVAVNCLALVSRLDLVALSMVSRRHRFVPESHELRAMRYRIGTVEPYLYVFMHMYPDPSPRWFVLHPVQRLLKPVHSSCFYQAPESGSCFVETDWGIYTIGGLINGKPTSEVTFFDCIKHTIYRVTPMKMARSGASASFIDKKKIYVFGGCWEDDVADDSSNWVEVFDLETGAWEFLSVFTPKMPLKIKQSVVIVIPKDDEKYVYAVDEDGQIFAFSPSHRTFMTSGTTEPNPETRKDWLLAEALFCRGIGGKLLWRLPTETLWKEVNGLEEQLQQQHSSGFDIIKICAFSVDRMAIFWQAAPRPPQGSDQSLELWYAELSLTRRQGAEGWWEVWANIEWSGAVLSDSSHTGLNLLYAASVDA